jgi:threonine synthase
MNAIRWPFGPAPPFRDRGIWRYEPLLPVAEPFPGYADDVGLTPLVQLDRFADELGVDLWAKTEGTNPSGSFKDRGLAVAIALGHACGVRRFCLPTQGNAGVAAALFCSRMGLPPCTVYMPRDYDGSIYHRAASHFGAEVKFHGENIAACGRQMRTDLAGGLRRGELTDVSTFFEPGRLEGKKTMGLEIIEQFPDGQLPEYIVYPTGGGTGLVGIWKALEELAELGVIPGDRRLPRMVAVQSDRCAPIVQAFHAGLEEVTTIQSRGTVADGLDVPGAIMGREILRVLRESGGTAVSVEENSIVDAFSSLGRIGVSSGYEGAATLAGLKKLRQQKTISEGARVLLLITSGYPVALSRRSAG